MYRPTRCLSPLANIPVQVCLPCQSHLLSMHLGQVAKLKVKNVSKKRRGPACPPGGMGPICRPLTYTRLQRAADLEERCGAGASHALPSGTSAWSRKDFTTKVCSPRASGLPSPAALRCRKAASGVGLGLLPFRTQDSNRPRHSRPSFQGQEELEESDASDSQE